MIIQNKTGMYFPWAIVFLGYFLLLFGIIAIYKTGFLAIAPLLLGLLFSFTTFGVVIDTNQKILKPYYSFCGIKTGKWYDVSDYKTIKIHSDVKVYTTYSRANLSTSYKETLYGVYIVDHEDDQLLIKLTKTPEEAEIFAKWFEEKWI